MATTEERLDALEATVADHEQRLTDGATRLTAVETNVTVLADRVRIAEAKIARIIAFARRVWRKIVNRDATSEEL